MMLITKFKPIKTFLTLEGSQVVAYIQDFKNYNSLLEAIHEAEGSYSISEF